LNHNLVLFWTETSRLSARIIEEQQKNVRENKKNSVEAMHKIKQQAVLMKEALLKGDLNKIGEILDYGWEFKRQMATSIVTPELEQFYKIAKNAGATGGKISGAGGGGFMFFYCPHNSRNSVINALSDKGGVVKRYDFTSEGLETWIFNN
jgi:D-glycero-alpha-D-manno-heptose-7-phosphate kinase